MELDKLRGVALLDASTPPKLQPSFSSHSLAIGQSASTVRKPGRMPVASPSPTQSSATCRSRKRVDFVLPRSLGILHSYVFAKRGRGMLNEELQTICEEDEDDETQVSLPNRRQKSRPQNESIEEILFPDRRRRREDTACDINTSDKGDVMAFPQHDKDTPAGGQVLVRKNEDKELKKMIDDEVSHKYNVEAKPTRPRDAPKNKSLKPPFILSSYRV